jgi:4-hydroxy-3-methylbut-2-enyl diphosphate reductase
VSGRQLTVLAPLAIEAGALRRGLPGAWIVRTGGGRRRAEAAKRAMAAGNLAGDRDGPVAVAGVCGALDPSLRPGDLVVATEVRGPDGEVVPCPSGGLVAAALGRAGLPVRLGPIVSSPALVTGPARTRLHATGALAVDLESAWLAAGVAEARSERPLAVVRAVADTPGRELRRPWTVVTGWRACRSLTRAGDALAAWAAAAGPRKVLLAGPRSFCAGVERAIEIVERALDRFGPPVYVRKQIVHNLHVVGDLERRGAVFVEELDEVPPGAVTVFSAHGVAPAVHDAARERELRVIDATCPLVSKVHAEARRFASRGHAVVLIGHEGHEEVEGTMGEAPEAIRLVQTPEDAERLDLPDGAQVSYLTQTTLTTDEVDEVVDALRRRFPTLTGPGSDDICYATTNRQLAVRAVARDADLVLVVGSTNSSNSRRLVEVAEREGCPAHLVDDDTGIDPAWLDGVTTVGLTAGASASHALVDRVVRALGGLGPVDVVERSVVTESVHFGLPKEVI